MSKPKIVIDGPVPWVLSDPSDDYVLGCWKDEPEPIISPQPSTESILKSIALLEFELPKLPKIELPQFGQYEFHSPNSEDVETGLAVLGGILQALGAVLSLFAAGFAAGLSSFCWPGLGE